MAECLSELLRKSSSTRRYFVSLPVWLQLLLHEEHDSIRTASQLHITAGILLGRERVSRSWNAGNV
ncbi:hypothetical protein [uncultured Clostridium sp.]|uniref:hypothetical protein n=1 Tax=uncultured Clostridium sp. TaxID=59620 RepID=UPI0025DFB6A6|nr:hypothetical protein [uncultured Clostridium sp.]